MKDFDFEKIFGEFDYYVDGGNFAMAEQCLTDYYISARDEKDYNLALLLANELIGLFRKSKDQIKCLTVINDALNMLPAISQTDSSIYGTTFINIGTAYVVFENYKLAEEYYLKAIDNLSKVLDKNHKKIASVYNNLGSCLFLAGDYKASRKYYDNALSIIEKNKDSELEVATTLVNIADLVYKSESENSEQEIDGLLTRAFDLLVNNNLPRNKHYTWVIKQCIGAYKYYGYFVMEQQLQKIIEKVDADIEIEREKNNK